MIDGLFGELPRAAIAVGASGGRAVASALDRLGARRREETELKAALGSADSRVLLVYSGARLPLAPGGGLAWRRFDEGGVDPTTARFLGIDEAGHARFSAGAQGPAPEDAAVLREVLGELSELDAAAALEAIALDHWHAASGFCSGCGSATEVVDAGHGRSCASCGARHFPRMDPAVIMLVTEGDRCVLGRRVGAPAGRWSTLAGFVEVGENVEEAIYREVLEEVGLHVDAVEYLGSQSWPMPASLMLAYRARAAFAPLVVDEEHAEVRWFERSELRRELERGTITIPPPIAAGHQLITGWLAEG